MKNIVLTPDFEDSKPLYVRKIRGDGNPEWTYIQDEAYRFQDNEAKAISERIGELREEWKSFISYTDAPELKPEHGNIEV